MISTTCDKETNKSIHVTPRIMTTPTFHAKSTALEVVKGLNVDLNGKLVLITGGTAGR